MDYKDLDVWKDSIQLTKKIYIESSSFPKEEVYGITSQIRRSSVSIASNIAEGAARNSNKEYIHFLYISLGSLAELETQFIISKEIGYTNVLFTDEILVIRKKILALIKYLKSKNL